MRKIFILIAAFVFTSIFNSIAAITVTPGTGGTNICSSRAQDGSTPAFNTLGNIIFSEGLGNDITTGPHTLVLSTPPGWVFNTAAAITFNFFPGRNITAVTLGGITTTTISVNVTTSGTTLTDIFSVNGVQIQATNTTSAAGNIRPTSAAGMAGLSPATNCASLSLQAAAVPSVTIAASPAGAICAGTTVTFTATPVNGGTPTFQWELNGSPVAGATNTTYVNGSLANGNTVRIRMNATGCVSTPTVNSATTTMTVNPIPASITGAFTVCPSNTTSLSSTTPGGIWTSSNTAVATVSSGTVNGVTSGTSTITYSVLGCITTSVVTVNTAPTAFSVTGGGSFCASSTTGLPVGLSGSTSGINYSLSDGSSTVATLPGTGTTISFGTFSVAGTYTVSATNPANTCSSAMSGSATIAVTAPVTPSITVNAPATTICEGTVVTFTSSSVNGGPTPAYQWYVNGVAAGTGSSYAYAPTGGDVVSLMLTPGGICTAPVSVTDAYTVTTTPVGTPAVTITVGPNNPSCLGKPVSFASVPTFAGTAPTYMWVKNGINVATGPTYSYIPVEGDSVYCEMTSNYVCRSSDLAMSSAIIMHTQASAPAPVVSIFATPGTTVPAGTTVSLTALVTGTTVPVSYQWLVNGTPIPGATSSTFSSNTFVDKDIVTCQVTNMDPCAVMTLKSVSFTDPTSVDIITDNNFTINVVPNPNTGEFALMGSVFTEGPVSIKITNILGQVVLSRDLQTANRTIDEKVRLNNVAEGIYLLHVNNGSAEKTIRFVIH